MKSPTWDKPVFRPEHVVRESDEEFWIDEKRIKGVVDNSVTVEKFGEKSIVTLSFTRGVKWSMIKQNPAKSQEYFRRASEDDRNNGVYNGEVIAAQVPYG